MACSSGDATVSAMVLGVAPGKVARTTIVGGTTSGYSAMGSRNIASSPMMKMAMDSTPAKIGRRMKKWAKFMSVENVCRTCRRNQRLAVCRPAREAFIVSLLGRHRHPRTDPFQAVDDNFFAGLQAGTDDALAVNQRPQLHRLIGDRVRWRQGEHEFLRLVGADGAFVHEQARDAGRSRECGSAQTNPA